MPNFSRGHCACARLQGRVLGLVLIFVTACIWIAASFISEALVSTKPSARSEWHVPPFILTYMTTSMFILFLPMAYGKLWLEDAWKRRGQGTSYTSLQTHEDAEGVTLHVGTGDQHHQHGTRSAGNRGDGVAELEANSGRTPDEAGFLNRELRGEDFEDEAADSAQETEAMQRECMTAAAWCFPLWFTAQYTFNVSLSLTSVTSNTILSSSSSLFTFALSMLVLRERYSMAKLASIAACIAGTVLVTLADSSAAGPAPTNAAAGGFALPASPTPGAPTAPGSSLQSVSGDVLCLFSAAMYACYTVVLRRSMPDDTEANVLLFFGYVGLFCALLFAPVAALMVSSGTWQPAAVPAEAYGLIFLEGVLNYLLSDYLWARAVLLLGPTVATLGLSAQIPLAAIIEPMLGKATWVRSPAAAALTVSGASLIVLGFAAGTMASSSEHVPGEHHRGEEAEGPWGGGAGSGGAPDTSSKDSSRQAGAAASGSAATAAAGSSRSSVELGCVPGRGGTAADAARIGAGARAGSNSSPPRCGGGTARASRLQQSTHYWDDPGLTDGADVGLQQARAA